MSKKRCPNCGAPIKDFCRNCQVPEINVVKRSVWFCKHCFHIKISNKQYWLSSNEERVKKLLEAILPKKPKFTLESYKLPKLKVGKKNLYLLLTSKDFEIELNYPIEVYVCSRCRAKQNQSYEAIIQIRPKNPHLLEAVRKKLAALFGSPQITNVKERKEGYDIYVKNWRNALKILNQMKRQYGGEIKTSRKLYTYDRVRSKRVYKVTILYRNDSFN